MTAFEVAAFILAALVVVSLAFTGMLLRRNRVIRKATAEVASYVRALRRGDAPDAAPDRLTDDLHAVVVDVHALRADMLARLDAAAKEREWLVSVLSEMPDGIAVTDERGIVVLANRALLDRAGVSESRAVGRLFIEVVRDHEVNEVVRRCLSTRAGQNVTIEREPGRTFLGVTATPLMERGGCVVVLQDVSEVHRLEKVRRDFVANISHELRTPLASLKLLAETIASGGAEEPDVLQDYVGRIDVEVDRLTQMVDELGELSVMESGQAALDRRPLNLAAVVARALERLEAQALRAGIRLEMCVPADGPRPHADGRRIEQVLVNLLHNAIKFTPPGGTVSVSASSNLDGVIVAVSDTGVGIPRDDLLRIFERFYKADRSRSSPGTGLGLALARHVIQAHGGRIWADSTEGRGSTFSFLLPLNPGKD